MNKRNLHQQIRSTSDFDDLKRESSMLENIQQKLEKSAALNGGFDKLLYKIDSIENSQQQIVEKVDKIHEAIYHPDDGLFARISSNKADHIESVSKVEKQIIELSSVQQIQQKSAEELEKENGLVEVKLHQIESAIENIKQSRSTMVSVAKWIGAAVGGGLITLVFKVIYEVLNLKH